MKSYVAYLRVNVDSRSRLHAAQLRLEKSIEAFGLTPLPFPVGRRLSLFGPVLHHARNHSDGKAFVWCNSDVALTRNPYDVPDPTKVYGFHRREIPSGEITLGVDMYYIPVRVWDEFLSKDIPKLYLGVGFVDWWISRAMQKIGVYENLNGYIDHETHGQSVAAGDDADPYYQHNFRAYNRWAARNGLEPIPGPPYLIPRIGRVYGVRHFLQKLGQRAQRGRRI